MFFNLLFEYRIKFIYSLISFFSFLWINAIHVNIIIKTISPFGGSSYGSVSSFYSFTPQNDFYSISSFIIFFTLILWFPYFCFYLLFSVMKGLYKYEFINYSARIALIYNLTLLSLILTVFITLPFNDLFEFNNFSSTLLTSLEKWLKLIINIIIFLLFLFTLSLLLMCSVDSDVFRIYIRKFIIITIAFVFTIFPKIFTLLGGIITLIIFDILFLVLKSKKLLKKILFSLSQ